VRFRDADSKSKWMTLLSHTSIPISVERADHAHVRLRVMPPERPR
jgi:hypothetical protein